MLWTRFQLLNSKVTLSKIVLITAIWGGIWKLWTSKKESCTKRRWCIQKTLKKGPSNGVISCTCIIKDLQIKVFEVKSCILDFWQFFGHRLCKQSRIYSLIFKYTIRSSGGRVVSTLASNARGPGFKPRAGHVFLFLSIA